MKGKQKKSVYTKKKYGPFHLRCILPFVVKIILLKGAAS